MKRILFICDQNPFGYFFGAQQRTHLFLKVLCEIGYLDLVCFTSEKPPQYVSIPNCRIEYFGELAVKSYGKPIRRLIKLANIILSFSPYSVYGKNKQAHDLVQNLLKLKSYDFIVIDTLKMDLIVA